MPVARRCATSRRSDRHLERGGPSPTANRRIDTGISQQCRSRATKPTAREGPAGKRGLHTQHGRRPAIPIERSLMR